MSAFRLDCFTSLHGFFRKRDEVQLSVAVAAIFAVVKKWKEIIAMMDLIYSLQALLVASWNVVISLLVLLAPWSPLIAWVAFWLLAVNWVKLREVMIQGGWIGVVLLGVMMILVWGVVAPPSAGPLHVFGLSVSNFVGKTVYVTALLTIMFLCGSVQLSGACGDYARFPDDMPERGHDDHAHDSHGGSDSHEHESQGHETQGHAHPAGH